MAVIDTTWQPVPLFKVKIKHTLKISQNRNITNYNRYKAARTKVYNPHIRKKYKCQHNIIDIQFFCNKFIFMCMCQ